MVADLFASRLDVFGDLAAGLVGQLGERFVARFQFLRVDLVGSCAFGHVRRLVVEPFLQRASCGVTGVREVVARVDQNLSVSHTPRTYGVATEKRL